MLLLYDTFVSWQTSLADGRDDISAPSTWTRHCANSKCDCEETTMRSHILCFLPLCTASLEYNGIIDSYLTQLSTMTSPVGAEMHPECPWAVFTGNANALWLMFFIHVRSLDRINRNNAYECDQLSRSREHTQGAVFSHDIGTDPARVIPREYPQRIAASLATYSLLSNVCRRQTIPVQ